jgi:transposase-like protein
MAKGTRACVPGIRNRALTAKELGSTRTRDAGDRDHAEQALDQFIKCYDVKWPKTTEELVKDREELLAFYAFPTEHWIHLKTTNPSPPSPRCGCAPR